MIKENENGTTGLDAHNQKKSYIGYGYGRYGDLPHAVAEPQRSFKDYLLMFRERIWYLIVALFIILSGSALYTFTKTKEYTATASLRLLRDDPSPFQPLTELEPNQIRSAEDFNTQIAALLWQ